MYQICYIAEDHIELLILLPTLLKSGIANMEYQVILGIKSRAPCMLSKHSYQPSHTARPRYLVLWEDFNFLERFVVLKS